jgi:hypothetical protein
MKKKQNFVVAVRRRFSLEAAWQQQPPLPNILAVGH